MWLLYFILPFLILAILEELIEFFVNRYALGPAPWEGKLKHFFANQLAWLKKKFKKEPSVS